MPGAKGMMLTVFLTFMTDNMHDGTPGRDGAHQQAADGNGEEEEMEEEEIGDGEGLDGDMFTHDQTEQTKRNERTHVAEDGDEDNIESHDEVHEDEHETTH